MLYFENLSGVKEDEYLRDGITEDIITELSKIKGLKIFSRPTVLAYRDKPVTPVQIGQQLKAVLRAHRHPAAGGAAAADHGAARGHADRLPALVRALRPRDGGRVRGAGRDRAQDRRGAAHQLSPQEQEALAVKPTDNLQAYDLYLRGKSFARRLTRQDLEFALQMFENAVSLDPSFALAHAAIANVCAQLHYHYERAQGWIERAGVGHAAGERSAARPARGPGGRELDPVRRGPVRRRRSAAVRQAIERKPDSEGAYYLLLRALFASGQYQEVARLGDAALEASGEDYNVYVPITNALGALGKKDALDKMRQREIQALEAHLKTVPEDARARTLLAGDYASLGMVDAAEREASLAIALRPNEAIVLYNAACVFCQLGKKQEALAAIQKAWDAGFRDPDWARRDPDLALLHGEPEFDKLYPATPATE